MHRYRHLYSANIECGYTCHAKCQMKAPQDCTGVNAKLEAKKSKKKKKGKNGEKEEDDGVQGNGSLKRTSTSSSFAPSINNTVSMRDTTSPPRTSTIPTRHISGAPPPGKYVAAPTAAPPTAKGGNTLKAKVLYAYDSTSTEELSVKVGDTLTVVEPDDGSGWVLANVGRDKGLVPASYIEIQTAEAPKKGPPVAPRRNAKKPDEPKKKYLRALYDYDAGSELELTIREGDTVVVVGADKGDGWTEVELKGQVGSVPSNYVEAV